MTKAPRMLVLVCAALSVSAMSISCATDASAPLHKVGRLLMGTYVQITVVGTGEPARTAAQAVVDEIQRVENLTSFHKPSNLTALNELAASRDTEVDPELLKLVRTSLRFARDTGGAFDPTVGPLSRLWNFSGNEQRAPDELRVPNDAEIEEALGRVGWNQVVINENHSTIRFTGKGMALDLGAIAKGYALDRAAEVLKKRGITAALVNAGGDILAVGEKGPGQPWRVGIQDPRNPRGIVAIVPLKDRVVVTSGDYERFLIKDGKRYHHLLDPRTGFPAEGLQSVTILAARGVLADALATAVFVLGRDQGMKLVEATPGVEALLIDASGEHIMSSGAAQAVELR